jgi:flagellar motor switch protein FliG
MGLERMALFGKRIEIERLRDELMNVFVHQPKVAKHVFTRVLTEEGVETTAQYLDMFGESVILDMLRDPSLQSDLNELTEFYAKNPIELKDDEKLELLRRLHNRTVAGKLVVMGSRSSNLFDFLADMDGLQISELIRNESLTVKSIVLTQLDPQKRAAIYAQLDDNARFQLMTELSRIDYLPRDFIFNVANALKRKRRENPKLNTEALPGSDVLLTLLERTGKDMQRTVMKNLELSNPESARNIKSKLVSLDTLRYLRDGQLLEVVLSLKHDELLTFLKAAPGDLKSIIFAKAPKDLSAELEEELETVGVISREGFANVERKIMNRMKLMANEGLINLVETNDRMLADQAGGGPYEATGEATASVIRKVGGW